MNSKKNLKRNLLICLLAGSAVMYTLPLHAATSVIGNNTLPSGGQFVHGEGNIASSGLEMNITQNGQNAVIKWNDFSVGGNATVNFDYTGKDNFNTLNYVNSGKVSQIYGTINAQHEGYNGNIFIVNTAGVQIGPSAQINVGSLHVSNKYLNESELGDFAGKITPEMINTGKNADAVLMSLGNINAGEVTFEGNGRIVIDSERIKDEAGNDKLGYKNINITTSADNTDNIIIGYDGYDATIDKDTGKAIGYAGANGNTEKDRLVTINGNDYFTKADGYMWVEDVEQLQAINTNLSGNYALRNSIDATGTTNWSDPEVDGKNEGFLPIGIHNDGKVYETTVDGETKYGFYGNFDGVDYNIFGLTINREDTNNVGLFGVAHDANINNVTLVGGSITGGSVVGSVVGAALGNTHITNATNSASVTGNADVGGIVGYSGNKISDGDNGNINVSDTDSHFTNLINTGAVYSKGESDGKTDTISNTGGLIGYMYNGTLDGNSYNLGDVSSEGHNVGGLVGHAVNSTIGNEGEDVQLVYNRLDVEGAYNVGGIVGNMKGTTVQNAENSGNVTASGYTTDKYIYYSAYQNVDDGTAEDIGNDRYKITVNVNAANVGGIAGTSSDSSTIENVANTGDVNSRTDTYEQYGTNHIYYTAGNVGGVVGRAEDTNITNATNRENEVRGAHNVGGVAGYFGGEGTVNGGINDGGDIMATGARFGNDFMTEHVRSSDTGDETFIIGNIGGVVGYMDGDNVYVTGSANRGTVHSQDIDDPQNVLYTSQAANTGGVVGRINRSDTKTLAEIQNEADKKEAAVNNSYNTGDVRGYAGVGGVVGMMYNGEVANSYNLGAINTTRRPQGGNKTSVNMGGVVGDTTEESNAKAIIYNVYNKGQIGDETYNFYARHVGGVVGRLSGTVDKAYNTGAIYNGYSVVGGIAGWFYEGTISNSFNTGNITVLNKETAEKAGSQVGGIAGGMSAYGNNGTNFIYNAYNLGTLRSFNTGNLNNPNSVGGIVGKLVGGGGADTNVSIRNVYTTSNIYSGTDGENASKDSGAGSIYGDDGGIGGYLNLAGANYIELGNSVFNNLEKTNANVKKINYNDRYNSTAYNFVELNTGDKIWADVNGANVSEDGYWRIYKNGDGTGTTPILNAFLPNAEDYFSGETDAENPMEGISSIQYGTAYDPLLTIIKANEDLTFDWGALGIQNDGGLAVYNAGLTLTDFKANGGTGYFGGIIYADESLNLNGTDDIGLGSASQIYGSDVAITTDGKVTIYGDITATGNQNDSNTTGGITINAGDVDVYGTLTSAKGGVPTKVSGIAQGAVAGFDFGDIKDKDKAVTDIGNRFAVDVTSSVTGNIIINAGTKVVTGDDGKSETVTIGDGNVNLYYGNKQEGLITTGGDLNVTGTGDVYVDSDLAIGGNLTLEAGAGKEALLDITNIGQVQNNHDNEKAKETLHNFLDHFATNQISFGETQDAKITVDMWNGNTLDLSKFDYNGTTLVSQLNDLNVDSAGNKTAKQLTHIWVNNGEQLKNIQTADDKALDYNFALKGDINASDVENYVAIGTGNTDGFTGTFDGRGNRIIGLNVSSDNAGIFSEIGTRNETINGEKVTYTGTVKNVNIYSGNFEGKNTAGAVAGENNGRIENIITFGNTVTSDGKAGGIVGVNNSGGTVDDVESTGSVIAGSSSAVAGGLVGKNDGGLANSFSDSAVTVKVDNQNPVTTTGGLGGVVGVNTEKGNVQYVDSLGVTNGGSTGSSNVGGVIGINKGNMYSGYNESIVSGSSNVGGIIGNNSSTVSNVVNATSVTGKDKDDTDISEYVGGLVGTNSGSVTNGRNNGTITGTDYVGGMVGNNAAGSTLTNLVNDSSAAITGEKYVGGIAGKNDGIITANNNNLINRGSITGNQYVGGVAGMNTGEIRNTVNSVVLNATGNNAQYFGGVAGYNDGIIGTVTNTSAIDVTAQDGTLVGGIIGYNAANGTLEGEIVNEGSVSGKSQVGGIIGKNDNNNVLQGTENDRLTVTNDGTIDAEEGGAAGIFYENNGEIKYADISNNGLVDGGDKEGGTGGLFGINNGDITESTLNNSGTVIGGGNVGGLIGVNKGNVSDSSLTNTGSVTGSENVGGLIGKNTGTITGGRDDNNSYYKDQIYNNGTITGTENGSNIGGLIGYNADESESGGKKGSLTAGYNTGAINAENSTNVGGIVGNNAGTVDQVFNTVMTADGQNAITGDTNVGGLVGTNSGTLSNAYNTTAVNGAEGSTGNAVGVNDGNNAKVNFVYDVTNTNNTLIGKNTNNATISNSYTSADAEKGAVGTVGITYVSADKANDKDSYDKFAGDTWKFYDGNSNPLLKVFLTNLVIKDTNNKGQSLEEFLNLVYNGKEQDLNINVLIEKGFIEVPDEEALKAYYNTVIDKESGESHLLQNADGQVDAKGYSDWLYSNQIAANTDGKPFNPNNLGYDITYTTEGGTIDIGKLSINITLDDIYRIYGNVGNIFSDSTTENKTTYEDSYHVNTDGLDDSLVNYIMDNLKVTFEDKAIDGDKTQNVGSYDWSMNVIIGGDDASNYQINSTGLQETIIKGENKSHVEKADLTITLDDVERIYGNIGFVNNTGYGITNVNGLTNGDEDNKLNLSDNANITDAALINVAGEERTNDVKGSPYDWTVAGDASNFTGVDNLGTNYNITVVAGNSKVTPKTVTIKDLLATIVYGNQDNKGLQINTGASLADGSIVYGDDVTLVTDNANYITGGKYDENRGNRVTADAGTYTDSLYVNGLSLNGNKTENYVLDTTSAVGDITVTKADLSITINGVGTTYGTAFDESQYGYTLDKLVNGDGDNNSVINAIENAINNASGGYHNTGAADGTNGKVTQDAEGDYSLSFKNDITQKDVLTNYNITVVKDGDVNVSKKQIHIGANTEEIHLGERPDYTGTDINGELVNGDKLNGNYHYGVEDSADEKVVGDHSIGVWIGNTFYDLSATVDWTKVDGFFSNYEVIYKPGTLTVTEQVMPDLPDNWPNNRWDYLFGDNPFDRNENFRERKAEVNFVDGAMEI